VHCALNIPGESIVDAIPLSALERQRKEELEAIVAHGLAEFLRVGSALAELRNRRLYRTEFGTFEAYVQQRFGLHRGAVDGVIRSAQTAQVLLDAGIQLPSTTTAAVLRPICGLPGEELKAACWQLAESLAPECGPTQPLVSRLCRVVRNCLEDVDQEEDEHEQSYFRGSYPGMRKRSITSPQREQPFARPVERLAAWSGFSVEIIVSNVKPPSAATLYHACGVLASRCRLVQERLSASYPELASHA
jgi:hypothetical protein